MADQRPAVAPQGHSRAIPASPDTGRATRRNPKGLQSCLAGSVGFSGNEVSGRGTRSGSGPVGPLDSGGRRNVVVWLTTGTGSRACWRRAFESMNPARKLSIGTYPGTYPGNSIRDGP